MDIEEYKLPKNSLDNLKVGIIDSGFDKEAIYTEILQLNNSFSCSVNCHGSIVANLLGSSANEYQGFFPNIKLYVYDLANDMSIDNLINAINSMIDAKVDVLNISLSTDRYSKELYDEVRIAISKGIVIISSSGNSGNTQDFYPSSFDIPGVISVGSIDSNNNILYTTTVNEHVDIYAPGESIYSISNDKIIKSYSGTSLSTPIVTALVILVKLKNSRLNPQQIEVLLKEGSNKYIGRWYFNKETVSLVDFKKTLGRIE